MNIDLNSASNNNCLYLPVLTSVFDIHQYLAEEFPDLAVDPSVVIGEVINCIYDREATYGMWKGVYGSLRMQLPHDGQYSEDAIRLVANCVENKVIDCVTNIVSDVIIDGNPVYIYYPHGTELYIYVPVPNPQIINTNISNKLIPAQAIHHLIKRSL